MKWFAGGTLIALLFLGPLVGLLSQTWAPFWFGQRVQPTGTGAFTIGDLPIGPLPLITDEQRYAFALAAGWSAAQAITATAISIAENGSGNPAAMSGRNTNGSFDLGLWQINSVHWPIYGGQAMLIDPLNNARAGYAIYLRGGWTQWCTYPGGCGGGLGAANWPQALARAQRAANGARHQ